MTTALATKPSGGALTIGDGMTMQQIATACATSGFFENVREASQALVKIQAGNELGIPPVAAMTGIHIIKGKVSLGAILMGACVQRSRVYDFRIREFTDKECRVEFFKGSESLGFSSWTAADATRAGLAGGENWRKYPRAMLRNRAMADGVRTYCPGVLGGPVYTPDELGLEITQEGDAAEPTAPAAPKPERRTTGVAALNATNRPPVADAPTVEAEPHPDEAKVKETWEAAATEAQRAPTDAEKIAFAKTLRAWSGLPKDEDKTACSRFAEKCGKMLGQIGDLRDMEATIKDHTEAKRSWFDVMNRP